MIGFRRHRVTKYNQEGTKTSEIVQVSIRVYY
jgi:hypothetical protein